jgi:hypothetical protein
MKKTLLTLFLTAATVITFAQTINFGIKGGLNLSELYRGKTGLFQGSFIAGFNAGGIVDIGFQSFSIQSGIFYSTKGEKVALTLVSGNQTTMTSSAYDSKFNYIEVPINLLYKIKIVPGINIHLGGGPYFGYGVSETISVNNKAIPLNDNKFSNKNPDYGVNFIAGAEINRFVIDAGYGLGLANIAYNSTLENRVISLSVGYLFR